MGCINYGLKHCVKKFPYSELFWSAFFHIRTEYGEILRISPYSVQIRENNSEYGHNDEICPVDQSVNYLGASGILPVLHALRELKQPAKSVRWGKRSNK